MIEPAASRRVDSLLALPRRAKKALAILVDSALCVLTVWLAICFRFESWISLSGYHWLAVASSVAIAIPLLSAFGFYHTVIRYVGRQTVTAALRAIAIYAVIYSAIFTAYGFPLVPRTIGVLQPLLLLIGLAFIRLLAYQLFSEQLMGVVSGDKLPRVLIYGAGSSGQQLAASFVANREKRVVGFLDDDVNLHNARIAGIPVYSLNAFVELDKKTPIQDVLLAMPSLSRSKRNDIIKLLSQSKVAVRTLPSLKDLASGRVSEDDLRELDIEDLLGRDPVAPIPELLSKNIEGKVVLVTGAGGSIGSELCRQIAALAPSKLIMLDISEHALYVVNEQLMETAKRLEIELIALLCNVTDAWQVEKIFTQYRPSTVYHAAAYKHVPLVEANPMMGLRNNVMGTYVVAQAAQAFKIQNMVMISTDKAVRPTNIMGASKRLAEIVVQSLAASHGTSSTTTQFTLVRFGNVLGSSGSVVPKFREQIAAGGPLTVTHAEVTRFFMSVSEAAQLVIQAAALSDGSEASAKVYHLDMGASVKIIDLAKLMIQLSGLTLRDAQHPAGDIEIRIQGLRPAEKLYEELLVDAVSTPTIHPKILAANESFASHEDVLALMTRLARIEADPTTVDSVACIRTEIKSLVDLREP